MQAAPSGEHDDDDVLLEVDLADLREGGLGKRTARSSSRRRGSTRRTSPGSRAEPRTTRPARPRATSPPRRPAPRAARRRQHARRREGGEEAYVPSSHDARYFACSSVSRSIVTPIVAELEACDLLVDLARHRIDLPLERGGMLDRVLGRECLVRERHVHDDRGMALRGRDVHEPPLGEQEEAASVVHRELLDELARLARLDGERAKRRDVDLDVEVAGVAEDRAVLHGLHVLAGDHVLVAGRGAEDVADRGGLGHRQHLVAVHQRLERRASGRPR